MRNLLVNEAVEIKENDDDDGVDTEEVYQQFITNKERGFKRTSPTVSAVQFKTNLNLVIFSAKQATNRHWIV